MTELPSSESIAESYQFKIQDLEIWYNPTVFSSVSALIRTETHQFPLLIKEFSQGKLKLKNKLITNLQCHYDIRKHKYLPLKIQVDITLEYKGGKTLVKRFMINLNQFKTGNNKHQRIKILKSLQRMFSVEIIFKLQDLTGTTHGNHNHRGTTHGNYNRLQDHRGATYGNYDNENSHSTFKSESKFSTYRSNELSAMRHVRVPKTQNQIQQVRSLNTKATMMKSPKRMSDFIAASKKNPLNSQNLINTEKDIKRTQKTVTSPNKEQYNHYLKHLDNGGTEQGVEIKNSYVGYVQGDPYIMEEHKLYATITPSHYEDERENSSGEEFVSYLGENNNSHHLNGHHLNGHHLNGHHLNGNNINSHRMNSANDNSRGNSQYRVINDSKHINNSYNNNKQAYYPPHNPSNKQLPSHRIVQPPQSLNDQKQTNSLMLQLNDLRKRLSDLLYEKNKLYAQKQNNLLQYQTRDKQQKIRHRKQLTDQKQYYQELLRRKQLQLQQYKHKWSQIPTQIKDYDYYQRDYQLMETLDDSSERNLSLNFQHQHQLTGNDPTGTHNNNNQRWGNEHKAQSRYDRDNESNREKKDNDIKKEKKRIFQSTPIIAKSSTNNAKPNTMVINQKNNRSDNNTKYNNINNNQQLGSTNHNNNNANQHNNTNHNNPTSLTSNNDMRAKNQLQEMSEIESSHNIIIIKLKQQLQQKNKRITDLIKYKQLAHEQQEQLDKLNQLINQLNLDSQQHLEANTKPISGNKEINDNTYGNPQGYQLLKNNPTQAYNQQLQQICQKLSNQIQVLEQKILYLEQSNTSLNNQYNNKLSELQFKQSQLDKNQEQLKQMDREMDKRNSGVKGSSQMLSSSQEQHITRDKQLTQVSTLLKGKDAQIDRQQHQLTKQKQQIDRQNNLIYNQTLQINELKTIISKLNSKINQLIQINSQLYTNINQLQNEINDVSMNNHNSHNNPNYQQPQQIILHNYHLNPTNDQILNINQQQQDGNQQLNNPNITNSNSVVKVPSIVRVNRTQSQPHKPQQQQQQNTQYQPYYNYNHNNNNTSTNPNTNNNTNTNPNTQYHAPNNNYDNQNPLNNLTHNQVDIDILTQKLTQNINNLQRDLQQLNQQDAQVHSLIKNNHQQYSQQSKVNQKHLHSLKQASVNQATEALKRQLLSQEGNHEAAQSLTRVQNVNPNKTNLSVNPSLGEQTVTINLNPPHSSTNQLIKIQQTHQNTYSHQQYPNQPVKTNHQNTPRPNKNPQNINKNNNNNNNRATKNNTNNNNTNTKYTMRTVHNSQQKQQKASSIGARTYRSSRNQKKKTTGSNDSDDCGCC